LVIESEIDENVKNAIDLRQAKSTHTDFYVKLSALKDRIDVFNDIFQSKQPKFLKNTRNPRVCMLYFNFYR
jgi:hypothetical protein